MIGARAVVPQGLTTGQSDKNSAGNRQFRNPLFRSLKSKLQVLRGQPVAEGYGAVQVLHLDQGTSIGQCSTDNGFALHGSQQLLDCRLDLIQVGAIPGNEDGLGLFIVLGL